MNNTTVVSGFINKNNDIFEFEVPELTLDREQVEQIISDTDPKEHSHQISEIAGLETQLANILDQLDNIPAQSPSGITINLDDEPTAGSNNAVKSGGVFTRCALLENALDGKAAVNHGHKSIRDGELAYVSVHNDGEEGFVRIYVYDGGEDVDEIEITTANKQNLIRALATPSSTPEDADKLITSAAVHGALALKAEESHTHKIEDISKLSDITLLVLQLAAAADIEYLSWTTIDTNASYYSMTSLTVSNERAYTIGGVYKISDGTTTKYGQATSIDTEHHVVGFNEAFQGMSSSGITISKLS